MLTWTSIATADARTVPTLVLFAFIFAMTALAYRMVYPVVARDSLTRLALCDLALMVFVFVVVGARFYDSGVRFDFGLFDANWVTASLICLCVSEAMVLPGYLRRFDVFK